MSTCTEPFVPRAVTHSRRNSAPRADPSSSQRHSSLWFPVCSTHPPTTATATAATMRALAPCQMRYCSVNCQKTACKGSRPPAPFSRRQSEQKRVRMMIASSASQEILARSFLDAGVVVARGWRTSLAACRWRCMGRGRQEQPVSSTALRPRNRKRGRRAARAKSPFPAP
jgi:hypothetical protein